MEPIGAIAEGDWSSLSGIYTTEEADFMAQLLGNCPLPNQLGSGSDFGVSSTFWPSHESEMNMVQINNEGSIYSSEVSNASFFHFSQGSSNYSAGSSSFFPSSSQEGYYLSDSHPVLAANHSSSMFGMGDVANPAPFLIEADDCSNHEMSNGNLEESGVNQPEAALPECSLQPRRDSDMQVTEPSAEDKGIEPCQNPKKRSRSSEDVEKNKRSVRSKKSQKAVSTSNNDEGTNAGVNGPASSSCLSEDESNASHELNGAVSSSLSSKGNPALNLNGKTRASRGAATDPQSLYARKRRERINERLRILQNLVPNGTKVDISTMLEEAVQYVKFLQLQIKLLSSDDLWMYAPIAYNGMNIGLDLKVPTPKSS